MLMQGSVLGSQADQQPASHCGESLALLRPQVARSAVTLPGEGDLHPLADQESPSFAATPVMQQTAAAAAAYAQQLAPGSPNTPAARRDPEARVQMSMSIGLLQHVHLFARGLSAAAGT